jgi:two-component system sensor histidine kinase RegB
MKEDSGPSSASIADNPSLFLPIGQASAPAGRIVLSWLIRLRWFAAVGQLVAIMVAFAIFGLHYPIVPLATVLAATALTNGALVGWLALSRPRMRVRVPQVLTLGVLLLDVLLLTVLLYYTGGQENPFAVLFVLHVAMATLVLGSGWAWAVVAASAICYGLIAWRHRPLVPADAELPLWAAILGQWTALALVVGVLAYFIGRVVRALRVRDRELATMRERASLNERLASLTTLAAGAAHELGTPLGTIAVVAKEMELAARQLDPKGSQTASLADDAALVRQQVERCRQILERMRGDIAGRSTDEPGRCSPTDVIRSVQEQLSPDLRARLKISFMGEAPSVAVPQRALFQALQFLVNNAIEASEQSQPVSLDIGAADGFVCFRVRDQGAGMDAQTLRRATEPFFTTKAPGRGMGLGLFLVRLVAERNAGRFAIDSSPGRGTTAELELPIAHPRDA